MEYYTLVSGCRCQISQDAKIFCKIGTDFRGPKKLFQISFYLAGESFNLLFIHIMVQNFLLCRICPNCSMYTRNNRGPRLYSWPCYSVQLPVSSSVFQSDKIKIRIQKYSCMRPILYYSYCYQIPCAEPNRQ